MSTHCKLRMCEHSGYRMFTHCKHTMFAQHHLEFSGFIVHFLHQTFITPLWSRVNIFDFWNTDTLYDWLDDDLYLLAAVLHVLLLPVVVREERLARLGQQEEHHEPCGQQTAADRRTLLETFQSVRIQGVRGHKGVCFKATFKGLEVFETLKTLRYFFRLSKLVKHIY